MHSRKMAAAAALALGATIAFAAPAKSADLPQAGSFSTHTPGKSDEQTVQVGDKHFIGSGVYSAIVYNDAGSGPLHKGNMICKFWDESLNNGSYNDNGVCATSDVGGADKIFSVFSGKGGSQVRGPTLASKASLPSPAAPESMPASRVKALTNANRSTQTRACLSVPSNGTIS
jgi:hypothetical protein